MTSTLQKAILNNQRGAVLCRAAYSAPAAAGAEVMYMPAGLQTITPSQGGRSVTVQVRVDRASAEALEAQRAALEARGKRPYFDFNHEDGEASFWPTEFYWVGDGRAEIADGKWQMANRASASALSSSAARAPGIYARGEWSDLGQQAISGKRYRQFSPVFYVDDVRANPARIVCREDAKPNMGGLVNDPAFHTILPFWAKDAGASGTTQKPQPGLRPNLYQPMTHEEIAGHRARLTSLEQQTAALEERDTDDVTRLSHQAEHLEETGRGFGGGQTFCGGSAAEADGSRLSGSAALLEPRRYAVAGFTRGVGRLGHRLHALPPLDRARCLAVCGRICKPHPLPTRGICSWIRRQCARTRTPLARPKKGEQALGRSREGFSTKIHAATIDENCAVALHVTAGQAHDGRQFEALYESMPTDNVLEAASLHRQEFVNTT